MTVANALILIEPRRAWEAVSDAIRAANSIEGFTGEGGALTLTVGHKGKMLEVQLGDVTDFDIEGLFGKLSNNDYDWAVQLARGFEGEAPASAPPSQSPGRC